METQTIACPSCKNNISITYAFCPYCGYDLRPLLKYRISKDFDPIEEFLYKIQHFFTRPDEVYMRIALRRESIGPMTIITALAFLLSLRILAYPLRASTLGFLTYFFFSLITVIILMFFFSILAHIFIKLAGGRGTFNDTLINFIYSMIPTVIGTLIITIMILTNPPPVTNLTQIGLIRDQLSVYLTIQITTMLLSAYYFSYGLKHSHGFNKITSIIVSYLSFVVIITVITAF